MIKIQSLLICLLVLAGVGCQSNHQSETATTSSDTTTQATSEVVASLEKDVLAVHDSAMLDMSDMMRVKKAVTLQLTELSGKKPSAEVTQRKEQGLRVSNVLAKADEAMMAWMYEYNGDTLHKLDHKQAMLYLKEQQLKVNTVRQRMRKSIADAKTYLK
ncbi:hypothetical protein [Spirosoma flavum]|uniref:Viral A-type inclusion protein n=1 Tax=Spirosoma flavum TaxID=2048557 RepID=A0ABW6AKD9_9BACT